MAKSRKNLCFYAGLGVPAGVAGAGQLVDGTAVLAERTAHDIFEPEVLVETVCARVRLERVDQDGVYRGVTEAALDGLFHHLGAEAAVAGVGFADPDVDRPMAGLHAAPVLRFLVLRVDDLDEADRTAVDFGDEPFAPGRVLVELRVPVPVAVDEGAADVGILVPAAQVPEVRRHRGSQGHDPRCRPTFDGVNFGVQAHGRPVGDGHVPGPGFRCLASPGGARRARIRARARGGWCRTRAVRSRDTASGLHGRCAAWSGPLPPVGHRQAGSTDDDLRQFRDLRQDVNRGEGADFDRGPRQAALVALVEGEAAGADDGRGQDRRNGCAEVETVAAAVHGPVLTFRCSHLFPMGLLWRGGRYGTNRLSERRLRESITKVNAPWFP